MIRHVVLFAWAESVTDEQKATIEAELRKLPGVIPEIRSYDLGADAGINAGNFDFVVVADFDDQDDYLVYRDNPVHRKLVKDLILPAVATRAAVQYQI